MESLHVHHSQHYLGRIGENEGGMSSVTYCIIDLGSTWLDGQLYSIAGPPGDSLEILLHTYLNACWYGSSVSSIITVKPSSAIHWRIWGALFNLGIIYFREDRFGVQETRFIMLQPLECCFIRPSVICSGDKLIFSFLITLCDPGIIVSLGGRSEST